MVIKFFSHGHTLNLTAIGGHGRGAGIAFTLRPNGRYCRSTYGCLDQLTYNSSGSTGELTRFSLFDANDLSQANADASSPYSMIQADAAGYLGSATIVTQVDSTGIVPTQATPNSIVAVADSFVGQAWNLAGQSCNWRSMVTAAEMEVIGTPGTGHITTCVSGSDSIAMLVDNPTYVNGVGQILNSANDGSSTDIIVSAPDAASQVWAGRQATPVATYETDTPIVSAKVISDRLSSTTHAEIESRLNGGGRGGRLADATLPDGDYAVTAEVSAGPRLILRTTSAGNDIVASLTLARRGIADLPSGRLSLGFSAPAGLPNVAGGQHLSLAESGHTWVPYSTRKPTSKHATLAIRNSADRIVIPSNIVLTPRVLLGALAKLPTRQIEDVVEALVDVLFGRYGDPDLEVDPDFEDGDGV
jgi:hypothetical protein